MVTGDTDDAVSSIALIVLTAIGAVALAAFALAVWRGHSWGRSGGIVSQLLVIAVALSQLFRLAPVRDALIALGMVVTVCVAATLLGPLFKGLGNWNLLVFFFVFHFQI